MNYQCVVNDRNLKNNYSRLRKMGNKNGGFNRKNSVFMKLNTKIVTIRI